MVLSERTTTKQLRYTTGGETVKSRDFMLLDGKDIRLNNQQDYMEFLNFSISQLVASILDLNEAIASLQSDMRQLRVGQEDFVYGQKVKESDEVDQGDLAEEVET